MKAMADKKAVFLYLWRVLGDAEYTPITEYRFAPPRLWRIDVAFVKQKVAVEIEGGVYSKGRHTRASGFIKDTEKYNIMTVLGWRLLRFEPNALESDPDRYIPLVLLKLYEIDGRLARREALIKSLGKRKDKLDRILRSE